MPVLLGSVTADGSGELRCSHRATSQYVVNEDDRRRLWNYLKTFAVHEHVTSGATEMSFIETKLLAEAMATRVAQAPSPLGTLFALAFSFCPMYSV